MTQTCTCGATTDAPLCRACTTDLATTLKRLPGLVRDLEITATKQARLDQPTRFEVTIPAEWSQADAEQAKIPARLRSESNRVALPATALPIALGPAELLRQAVAGILSWGPGSTVRGVCSGIRDNIGVFRRRDDAPTIHAKALDLAATITATIDRRDPDVYAGPCQGVAVTVKIDGNQFSPTVMQCGAHLYASPGEKTVTCTTCGREYELDERKDWMLDQMPDAIAPTTAIANALTTLLEPVTPSMIRQMAYRGEISQRGTTRHVVSGTPRDTALYRIGDVIDVLAARAARKARKLSDHRPTVRS